MAESIEIRHDGQIVCRHLPIGRVTFETPFPSEFFGEWFTSDPDDFDDLSDEVDALSAEVSGLEKERNEERDRADEVERTLAALEDEVRAFQAGEDYGKEAIERLKEALAEAES